MLQSDTHKTAKENFIELLVTQAQELGDAHEPKSFWAKKFVSEWLQEPNSQTGGLPPDLVIGLDGGQARAMRAMRQTLLQKFKTQGGSSDASF